MIIIIGKERRNACEKALVDGCFECEYININYTNLNWPFSISRVILNGEEKLQFIGLIWMEEMILFDLRELF